MGSRHTVAPVHFLKSVVVARPIPATFEASGRAMLAVLTLALAACGEPMPGAGVLAQDTTAAFLATWDHIGRQPPLDHLAGGARHVCLEFPVSDLSTAVREAIQIGLEERSFRVIDTCRSVPSPDHYYPGTDLPRSVIRDADGNPAVVVFLYAIDVDSPTTSTVGLDFLAGGDWSYGGECRLHRQNANEHWLVVSCRTEGLG